MGVYIIHQRIYISDRVRRAGIVQLYCRQSGERLGESNLCKTVAGAVSLLYNIFFGDWGTPS